MTFPLKSLKMLGIITFALICLISISTAPVSAQIPSITVKVADTTATPNSLNTAISIFMDNIFDPVAGFNLYIQLDRPDIMIFQTDTLTVYDTTFWACSTWSGPNCIDSFTVFGFDSTWYVYYVDTFVDTIGSFDTVGTLTSGWDFVDTRSLSGVGTDLNIVGIADLPGGTPVPPIPSGQQGGVLLRVLADIYNISDTTTDRTVNILVQTDFKDHFSFSRPDGTSITWLTQIVDDTTCWICTQWFNTTCLNWQQALLPFEQCDSLEIGIDTIAVLDTANVNILNGSLTVLFSFVCGNIDGDIQGNIDISDLVFLVNYMFGTPSGPAPDPLSSADVNCSLEVDISDLVYLVNYMFGTPSGPAPCAGCN